MKALIAVIVILLIIIIWLSYKLIMEQFKSRKYLDHFIEIWREGYEAETRKIEGENDEYVG